MFDQRALSCPPHADVLWRVSTRPDTKGGDMGRRAVVGALVTLVSFGAARGGDDAGGGGEELDVMLSPMGMRTTLTAE